MTNYGTIPPPTSSSSTSGKAIEYLSRAKHQFKENLATTRPWKSLLQSISLPSSLHDATDRLKLNLTYFRTNYAIIILVILFFSLLWHPISLIVLAALTVLWLYFYFLRDEPLMIFHRLIDDRTVLIVLSILTFVVLLFTGAFWNVISAVLIGIAVVILHGVVRKTDDLFLDEEAAETTGLMSSSS
ncbi:PRA1 family protein F3-like [Apium graveolens]|uniref:PRA1 family protein F3-like n=1 Tax=Apium graveolens TaxID=4045 RepID=UPI003D79384F